MLKDAGWYRTVYINNVYQGKTYHTKISDVISPWVIIYLECVHIHPARNCMQKGDLIRDQTCDLDIHRYNPGRHAGGKRDASGYSNDSW